ncbi:hypothetical protein [Nocardia testacea]|uniref:hypothetical protein n=1 Tax=Nocardia testacea TaxID=248551 RepID=UPI003A8990D2
MDPLTLVAAAVAAGAAVGLTDTARQAVVDAYQGLKGLIARQYESVDVSVVEARPEVASRQAVLAEELAAAGAGEDQELVAAARYLFEVLHEHAPQAVENVGVRITETQAGEIEITDIASNGAAFIADRVSVAGKLKVSGIRAGVQEPPHPPRTRR